MPNCWRSSRVKAIPCRTKKKRWKRSLVYVTLTEQMTCLHRVQVTWPRARRREWGHKKTVKLQGLWALVLVPLPSNTAQIYLQHWLRISMIFLNHFFFFAKWTKINEPWCDCSVSHHRVFGHESSDPRLYLEVFGLPNERGLTKNQTVICSKQ